jgi:hypothetical protein
MDNSYYLAYVDLTNLYNAKMNVLEMKSGYDLERIIPLEITSDNLRENVINSIKKFRSEFDKNCEDLSGLDDELKDLGMISRHEAGGREDLGLISRHEAGGRENKTIYENNASACIGSSNGSPQLLFNRVMAQGKNLVYDLNIGRYIPRSTLITPSENGSDSGRFVEDLGYVKKMKEAGVAMKKIVQEALILRADFNKNPKFKPPSEEEPRQNCGLCMYTFPIVALQGRVPFKTAANWRADRGDPISSTDLRFDNKRAYDHVKLCLFCLQQFDADFGINLDEAKIEIEKLVEYSYDSPVKAGFKTRQAYCNRNNKRRPESHPNSNSNSNSIENAQKSTRPMSRMQLTLTKARLMEKKTTGEILGRYQLLHRIKRSRLLIMHLLVIYYEVNINI